MEIHPIVTNQWQYAVELDTRRRWNAVMDTLTGVKAGLQMADLYAHNAIIADTYFLYLIAMQRKALCKK